MKEDPHSPLNDLINAKPKEIDVSLNDPLIFSKLLTFATAGRDNSIQLNIKYDDKTISYLKKKQFTEYDQDINIPWGFSEGGKDLAYHEFGTALSKYDDKTVQQIARIVLRLMRSASRNKAEPKDQQITQELLAEIAKTEKKGEYSPLELVGQLLAATASEAGRAPTGYLNNYVTLHKLKHTPHNKLMGTMLKEIFYPDEPVPKYYTTKDKVTKQERVDRKKEINKIKNNNKDKQSDYDETRHATAFEGSQHSMRVLSNIEKLKQYKGDKHKKTNEEINKNFERYKTMTERDEKYLSNQKSKKDSNKSKWQRMRDHYSEAVNHEKTKYYGNERISVNVKPDGKPMPKLKKENEINSEKDKEMGKLTDSMDVIKKIEPESLKRGRGKYGGNTGYIIKKMKTGVEDEVNRFTVTSSDEIETHTIEKVVNVSNSEDESMNSCEEDEINKKTIKEKLRKEIEEGHKYFKEYDPNSTKGKRSMLRVEGEQLTAKLRNYEKSYAKLPEHDAILQLIKEKVKERFENKEKNDKKPNTEGNTKKYK